MDRIEPTPRDGVLALNDLDTQTARTLALAAAEAASDKKASDVRILDLGELLGITDYFVLVSATNERQLASLTEEVERQLKERLGRSPRRREGQRDTGWMLLDYGDIVVHAFTEEQRRFYDLERLWSDAPVVPFTTAPAVASSGDPWYTSDPPA